MKKQTKTTIDVIHSASNKDSSAPGASGVVQDHQEHHQDDQEQLQDHFHVGCTGFKRILRRFQLQDRFFRTSTSSDGGPTYPIFFAVKATILGHILAPCWVHLGVV